MTDLLARVATMADEAKRRNDAARVQIRRKLEAHDPALLGLLDELRTKMGQGIKLTRLKLYGDQSQAETAQVPGGADQG